MKFYLGVDHPSWLWNGKTDFPLFVSHASLRTRKTRFPAAVVPAWVLDSMGFTMLRDNGTWAISPRDYVEAVIRYDREVGRLEWAAPQDWMCEDAIINGGTFGGLKFKGTGLTVDEHQKRTVANFRELARLWGEYRRQGECERNIPFRPVLQGEPGSVPSYLRCAQMYEDAGIRLADYPVVGIGSVCRLQAEPVIRHLAVGLGCLDLPLHWFGLKLTGLPEVWPNIHSCDSMAWAYTARRAPRSAGCTHVRVRGPRVGQPSPCTHCPRFAALWREQVLALAASLERRGYQGELFPWTEEAA